MKRLYLIVICFVDLIQDDEFKRIIEKPEGIEKITCER